MRYWLLALILVLSFAGISVSWYLMQTSRNGGIPLGAFGTLFYALVFALSAFLLTRPRKRPGYIALAWVSGLGALVSMLLLMVQGILVRTSCAYCLVASVLSLAVFAAVFAFHARYAPPKLAVVG